MKTIRLLLLFSLLAGLGAHAAAAERASITGILISASNEPGASDGRLAAYESTLKRILRFESFRHLGDDRKSLAPSESALLALGYEHQVEVTSENSDGKVVHLRIRWQQGGRTLMNTTLLLRPGVPAVLGGPSTGKKGEVFAVILVGR